METQESVKVSRETTRRSEIMRALRLWPDFLVHMTQASSRTDLKLAAKKTRGIVVCPRANAVLAEGLPDIQAMNEAGCNIAIGTDNVMVNSPDMFREMDYLWKATMASSRKFMDPRHILKMATVNAGKILKRGIGSIESEKLADCVFIEKHSIDSPISCQAKPSRCSSNGNIAACFIHRLYVRKPFCSTALALGHTTMPRVFFAAVSDPSLKKPASYVPENLARV